MRWSMTPPAGRPSTAPWGISRPCCRSRRPKQWCRRYRLTSTAVDGSGPLSVQPCSAPPPGRPGVPTVGINPLSSTRSVNRSDYRLQPAAGCHLSEAGAPVHRTISHLPSRQPRSCPVGPPRIPCDGSIRCSTSPRSSPTSPVT